MVLPVDLGICVWTTSLLFLQFRIITWSQNYIGHTVQNYMGHTVQNYIGHTVQNYMGHTVQNKK